VITHVSVGGLPHPSIGLVSHLSTHYSHPLRRIAIMLNLCAAHQHHAISVLCTVMHGGTGHYGASAVQHGVITRPDRCLFPLRCRD
jgi:hypothetical protein